MVFSVESLLRAPTIVAAEPMLHAGEDSLRRRVKWVHPAEVADIAYLINPDEIIITSWSFLPLDVAGVREYVNSLEQVGAAGLIVELGRRFEYIPRAIVEAVADTSMVLIALRKESRFADIVEEVGSLILDSQVGELRAQEVIYEAFSSLGAGGADASSILALAAEHANMPAVLESNHHRILAYALPRRSDESVLHDWERRSRAQAQQRQSDQEATAPTWLSANIGSEQQRRGRLVLLADAHATTPREALILRQTALALTTSVTQRLDQAEEEAHTQLLQRLLAAEDTADVRVRCAAFGLDTSAEAFVGVAFRPALSSHTDAQRGHRDIPAVLAALRQLPRPMLLWSREDYVLALVGVDPSSLVQLQDELLDAFPPELSISAARGEAVARLSQTHQSLQLAEYLMSTTRGSAKAGWLSIGDLQLGWLLKSLVDDDRLPLFVQRELGPILSSEPPSQRTSRLDTLRAVLETRGGKNEAANRLFISRPALYERVARLEALLGVDLNDPVTRTSLHAALIAHDLLATTEHQLAVPGEDESQQRLG